MVTAYDDSADELASVTFDHDDDSVVVIVGSGAGGGTLANELSQKAIDVVLLEAGPRIPETEFENDEYAASDKLGWNDPRTCTGNSYVARTFADTPASMCKGVGGTTLHWAGLCPRFQAHEFRAATTYGAVDGAALADWPLGLEDLEPYYERAEAKMGVTGTNGIPRHRGSNNYRVVAAGARRIGYTEIRTGNLAINSEPRDGRNACDQIGFCMQGCTSGARWTTANSEIPKAEASGRCEVRPECMALKIEHDQRGRVTGALYADRGGAHHVQKARAVCVAGNAIETPRLLLNSETSAWPDGLGNSSGAVGRHYMHHTSGNVFAEFDRPVNMYRGIQNIGQIFDEGRHDPSRGFAGGFIFVSSMFGLPNHAALLSPGSWGRDYASWIEAYERIADIGFAGEDMPLADNRVSLHPERKDRYGLPIPTLRIDECPNEHTMRNYAYRKAGELFAALGARRVIEATPLPSGHNLGTCRMSAEAGDGVVDRFGRAHDVPNLFVSDGSQFTTSGAANPTLTIVALAIRQSEFIAAAMQRGEL